MVGCVPSHDAARCVCTDEDRGVGAAWLFQAPPLSPCFKWKGNAAGEGEHRGRAAAFLPNGDLIGEPEHAVCEDATGHDAAPFLAAGPLAL